MKEQKRIVAYIDKEDFNKFKIKLILIESSPAQWLRTKIKEFITQDLEN